MTSTLQKLAANAVANAARGSVYAVAAILVKDGKVHVTLIHVSGVYSEDEAVGCGIRTFSKTQPDWTVSSIVAQKCPC